MDFNSLMDMMNEERSLYCNLRGLFDAKKQALIKNDIKSLSDIDCKILKVLDSIKRLPVRDSFNNLMVFYPDNKYELDKYQKEFKKYLTQISDLNDETRELIKQGMKLADTKLKMMIRAGTQSQGYSKYGNFEMNTITTIVQEV